MRAVFSHELRERSGNLVAPSTASICPDPSCPLDRRFRSTSCPLPNTDSRDTSARWWVDPTGKRARLTFLSIFDLA